MNMNPFVHYIDVSILMLISNILTQVGEYQGAYKVRHVKEMISNSCDI